MSLTFHQRRVLKRLQKATAVDWAEQDRKQLLLHTRVSPLLQEATDGYERERQARIEASLAVSVAVAAIFVVFMVALWLWMSFA